MGEKARESTSDMLSLSRINVLYETASFVMAECMCVLYDGLVVWPAFQVVTSPPGMK